MRVTAAQRIVQRNRAEIEIQRFAQPDPATGIRPHVLWHKHVHNVELDPMQALKMQEMDQHPATIDFSSRRTGKTAVKESYILEELATTPAQECGIVAPRQQQSENNINYHLEAIRRSPILKAYLAYKSGRVQMNDTAYQFANGSSAACYGIMSQIDGDSISIASLEETDDMPYDRLTSRFLPMLGSSRRLGVDPREVSHKPRIRISGVFKGSGVVQALIETGVYQVLPIVDVYLGLELGVIDPGWVEMMRAQNTEAEWIRQFLCKNIAAQNWVWEKYLRRSMAVGLAAGLAIAEPLPGARYKRRGLVAFGYDHSGHGERPDASRSALVVSEQIGNFVTFPYVRRWPAGTDDNIVKRDLVGLWEYFDPDYAMGDAYGLGMLTDLNDQLFARGLTDVDRRTIGDGDSTATTWAEWPFSPIRFDGMAKHSMASMLRATFHHGQAAIPYFDDMRPENEEWAAFIKQLGNVKAEATTKSYNSYKMAEPKVGDDYFDAAMAGVWALATRGGEDVQTVIAVRQQTRDALLGQATKPRLLEAAA
jgi:hypothetical protein